MKVHIVSASRRTDIPAFYSRWFLNRVDAGYCHWLNPFGGQVYRVSLRPEDCLGLVFWTRYAAPMLPHLAGLRSRGFRFYFHVSITGYAEPLELHNPPLEKALAAFRALSDTISPDLTLWRYDPIVLSDVTPPEYHLERFERLAAELGGYTRRCYLSFLDNYGKTRRNLARIESMQFRDPDTEQRQALMRQLRDAAAVRGITLYACCEDSVAGEGVEKAHCVDLELLGGGAHLKRKPTREQCGCIESIDIGAYDTCRFGCAYCYATNSPEAANKRAGTHDAGDSLLWRPATLAGKEFA